MTDKQHEILSLIADHTRIQDGLNLYWCPNEKQDWCESLKRHVWVDGGGFVSSLRAMDRKGWIKNIPNIHRYGYGITEDGRLALETHREKTGFYL